MDNYIRAFTIWGCEKNDDYIPNPLDKSARDKLFKLWDTTDTVYLWDENVEFGNYKIVNVCSSSKQVFRALMNWEKTEILVAFKQINKRKLLESPEN